jgi:hypothetical protein
MATKECLSCGGIYEETMPDGLRYFHACPPIRKLAIRLADGKTELRDGRVTVTEERDARGEIRIVQTFDPPLPAGATFLEERTVERQDKRDENVLRDPAVRAALIRAEGKGTRDARR